MTKSYSDDIRLSRESYSDDQDRDDYTINEPNPLNDEHWDGNDDQINALKGEVERLSSLLAEQTDEHASTHSHSLDACPSCGSRDFWGGRLDPDGDAVSQEVRCEECGQSWTEQYAYKTYWLND